jgi:hypothetical protein
MRTWLYHEVVALMVELDPYWEQDPKAPTIMEAGSYGLLRDGVDMKPDPPLIVVRGGTHDPRGRKLGSSQRFTVWVHDYQGSYVTNIEPIIDMLGIELPKRAPTSYDGWRITACELEGTSEDLFDPDKGTAVRNVSFLVTGRALGSA